MRTSTAYFAGAGTVIAAVVAGLGGGLVISNIVSPHPPRTETTRLEQRMSPQPIPVISAPSEPVPYVAATQAVPEANTAQAPAPPQAGTKPPAQAAEAPAAPPPPNPDTKPAPSAAQFPAREPAAAPEEAFAKARDADVKGRDADVKGRDADVRGRDADVRGRDADVRRTAEKRRAERRQQWADRRHYRQRQDQELQAVEEKIREETEPRRTFPVEPARIEMPRIHLLDDE